MKIMPNRMDYGFFKYQAEFEKAALEILRSGWYILGPEVEKFEKSFAEYVGVKYCAGLASGLDALWIGCKKLGIGPGDEVIVQGNTYIASVMGITMNQATPVFVEPDEYYQINADLIEEKITDKTKAVMVVSLYGLVPRMDRIVEICRKHHLLLIEDCAQSHGALFQGRMTGSFGDVGCFSFYPSKNLGAFGDAGALVTNDEKLIRDTKIFRNYGSEKRYYNREVGANSRLDELQAALLQVKLSHLKEIIQERRDIADRYSKEIKNGAFILPKERPESFSVWHQYVIRCPKREELIRYLQEKEIGTIIHYPIPPHLSEAYGYLGYKRGELPLTEEYADTVLSIPMYNGMTPEEQDYVISALNAF